MKLRTSYVCQQCAYESSQWLGKCPNCDAWSSLVETVKDESVNRKSLTVNRNGVVSKPLKLSEVEHVEKRRLTSGFGEFDRVMGGGIVPGSVTLLAGDPGIGKSTILLHVIAKTGGLYVSGEESAEQIQLRAKRLGISGENISIFAETNVEAIAEVIRQEDSKTGRQEDNKTGRQEDNKTGRQEDNKTGRQEVESSSKASLSVSSSPRLVIIDSIQTLVSSDLDGMAGSVGQIRHCAEVLVASAKSRGVPIIIIGHVTKEGTIAGPKVLEHMVDTVLYLEGERFANARILRTLKNRFGAIEEVGIFEMVEKGLKEIDNPSALFLEDRVINVPGSVVTVIMEGTRPMLVEIQALVVSSQLAIPRRVGSGVNYNRLQLLVAILQKRLNIPIGTSDIFVNVSGGMKIDEPAADLAIAMAIISSFKNKSLDSHTAVFGELGLLGEIRRTGSEDRRIKEAKRLGFTTVISPSTSSSLVKASQSLA